MLETTRAIYQEISFFAQNFSHSAPLTELEPLFKDRHCPYCDVMDLETKQQILHSLLFRIRTMSRIRRLPTAKFSRESIWG